MELWIRSQDKTRLKQVKEIYFNDFDCLLDDECNCLGTYETKERALEVLDEIHQRLINLQCIELIGASNITQQMKRNGVDCVYEMPKE